MFGAKENLMIPKLYTQVLLRVRKTVLLTQDDTAGGGESKCVVEEASVLMEFSQEPFNSAEMEEPDNGGEPKPRLKIGGMAFGGERQRNQD